MISTQKRQALSWWHRFVACAFLLNVTFSFFFFFSFFHQHHIFPSLGSLAIGTTIPLFLCLFVFLFWPSLFISINSSVALALLSAHLYQNNPEHINTSFFLKYLLSSQCLIAWMCVLFGLATLQYWISLITKKHLSARRGRVFSWMAISCAMAAILIRWYESYLIGFDVGHIPFSNLYEVFILFMVVTGLIHLWYEKKFPEEFIGAFILPVIIAAGFFIIWYGTTRNAYQIQPLLPALQSYWMKIHVPANFIGYGCFSASAMIGIAYLLRERGFFLTLSLENLEHLMHQLTSTGFLFFTLATFLGALWAANAWGSYWQWDPKETWSLIVWLNYAAWLHMRLVRQTKGTILAWWSIIGLFITLFAFLGVNIFLSGLHSYGKI